MYQYALVDTTGKYSSEQLRTYQDWYLRYALQTVPGVAEVAPVGGFVRQYQVNVDPNKLLAYKIPINMVRDAVQKSNNDVGGRLVEFGRSRVHGAWTRLYPIARRYWKHCRQSTIRRPARLFWCRDVATVTFGPDMRRGVGRPGWQGEAVGGVVIMRYGENAEKVIDRVNQRDSKKLSPHFRAAMKIVTTYDRSQLIDSAVDNLKHTLIEELVIVSMVI